MNWLKKLFGKTTKGIFPEELHSKWFAGCYHEKEQCCVFPYWDEEDNYIRHRVGDIVPVYEKEGQRAYYKIEDIETYGGDRASFDDGRHYHLTLDHVESLTPLPAK
jgi:hypothetical protein